MTPYRYFADKNAILAAVRARAFTRHADALEAAWAAHQDDPIGASNAVGEAYVAFAFAHPEAYKLMFDISQPDETDYPEFMAAAERSRRTMTRHLEGLAAAGRFDGDPGLVGHMYWAALHGPIMLAFSGKLQPQYDAPRLIAALLETLSRGLSPAFPTPRSGPNKVIDAPGVSGGARAPRQSTGDARDGCAQTLCGRLARGAGRQGAGAGARLSVAARAGRGRRLGLRLRRRLPAPALRSLAGGLRLARRRRTT